MSDITNLLTAANRRDLQQRREIKELSVTMHYLLGEIGNHLRTEVKRHLHRGQVSDWIIEHNPDLVDALEDACAALGQDTDWWMSHTDDAAGDI